MPMAAEPQPTRIRCSSTPLTIGALPACITTVAPSSMETSTASRLQSLRSVSQVTRPSFLEPPVRCSTPPRDSIREPYSLVITWPTGSPSTRTTARSWPMKRSGSIFTFTPQ